MQGERERERHTHTHTQSRSVGRLGSLLLPALIHSPAVGAAAGGYLYLPRASPGGNGTSQASLWMLYPVNKIPGPRKASGWGPRMQGALSPGHSDPIRDSLTPSSEFRTWEPSGVLGRARDFQEERHKAFSNESRLARKDRRRPTRPSPLCTDSRWLEIPCTVPAHS